MYLLFLCFIPILIPAIVQLQFCKRNIKFKSVLNNYWLLNKTSNYYTLLLFWSTDYYYASYYYIHTSISLPLPQPPIKIYSFTQHLQFHRTYPPGTQTPPSYPARLQTRLLRRCRLHKIPPHLALPPALVQQTAHHHERSVCHLPHYRRTHHRGRFGCAEKANHNFRPNTRLGRT